MVDKLNMILMVDKLNMIFVSIVLLPGVLII